MLAFGISVARTASRACVAHTSSSFVSPAAATQRTLIVGLLGRRRVRRPTTRMVVEEQEEVDPGVVAGTDLRVLRYPHPKLRAENAEVVKEEFGDDLKRTAREMLKVMYASKGVGLAAPQVGINKRLMVFNPDGDSKAWLQEVIMVNPSIIGRSKASEVEMEACLSFPGMGGNVRRHDWVKVEAYRLNGKKFKVKYEGWQARVFQHEFDHLDGIMYIDRLDTEEDRTRVRPVLDKLIAEYRKDPFEDREAAL